MYKKFRIKLFLTMIVFAVMIAGTIAFVNFNELKKQTTQDHEEKMQHIEDMVTQSLETTEKAYYFLDQEIAEQMENISERFVEKYQRNPDFDTWNFAELKKEIGMDIYIINQENEITHSSFADDIGMDFDDCCSKLAVLLDQYRMNGIFHHDGMEVEQKTGKIKKYSYMGTPDGKYVIELGNDLGNEEVFHTFNFLEYEDQLTQKFVSVESVRILNIWGLAYGMAREEAELSGERKEVFSRALGSNTEQEMKKDGFTYRYIPYQSEFDSGTSEKKVIELVMNRDMLTSVLDSQRNKFFLQMTAIIVIAILVAALISRWVSIPMHLAFHDGLTKLKNRTAFEEVLNQSLAKRTNYAFLMIDLDYFKSVNDLLGHEAGDRLLKKVAFAIEENIPEQATAYRYGGDEFVVIIKDSSREEAVETANRILKSLEEVFGDHEMLRQLNVSASIGISLSPDHGKNASSLFRKADAALYQSKEKGKNQWGFLTHGIEDE